MCLMHNQAYLFSCTYIGGAPMINYCRMAIFLDVSFMPCPNHVVINAPKRGRLKVQVSLKLYFGVMTMWLVELISVAIVYLRILVPSCLRWRYATPQFKKIKGVVYRRLEGFRFGLI